MARRTRNKGSDKMAPTQISARLHKQFRERTARDLADRSLPGMVAYTAVWAIIAFATGYHREAPVLSYSARGAFVCCGILRLAYQLTHKRLIRDHFTGNMIFLGVCVFLPAAVWSGIFAYFFVAAADSDMRLLVVIATIGLCSGGSTSYAPIRQMSAAYAGVITLPTCVGIVMYNPKAGVFVYLMIVYICFTLLLMQRGHREYWTALANEAALEEKTRQLEIMSQTDALTGVSNRRFFDKMLDKEWRRGSRHGNTLTLLIIDIDHFKRINDTHGHLAGDAVLREAAQRLEAVLRDGDLIGRYGGEEFLVLINGEPADAPAFCERLRGVIADQPFEYDQVAIDATVSGGFVPVTFRDDCNASELLAAADNLLYEAKAAGRDRIFCHRQGSRQEAKRSAGQGS